MIYILYLQVPFLEPKRTGQILTRRQDTPTFMQCFGLSERRNRFADAFFYALLVELPQHSRLHCPLHCQLRVNGRHLPSQHRRVQQARTAAHCLQQRASQALLV